MNKVPNPVECGLPAKFAAWRDNQAQAIQSLRRGMETKRVLALSAPTGFGKSPVYVAHALMSDIPTCIVTNSKGLQTQLMNDYASIGLVDIRGQANYQCQMREDYSCQEGRNARCPYRGTMQCPYSRAENRARAARLVVTNYDKWMQTSRLDSWSTHFGQVIFDEGHDAPDALARVMQITLTNQNVEQDLQTHWPRTTDSIGCWKVWACAARDLAEQKFKEWEYQISCDDSPRSTWIKQMLHMKNLHRKLCVLASCRIDNWVVEEVERGFQFDPIGPGQYAEGRLFMGVPHIVIVSATLRPKTMFMIGVGTKDFEFFEYPSDFDRTRCPIYWIPTMRVNSRAGDLSPLWIKLDQIMSSRADRKGIVHTVSYARQQDIWSRSRHRNRMILNTQGELAEDTVNMFKCAGKGTILVSPSVSTGYDFPGSQCEWQFIAKIPFQDGRSKIHKARQERDKEYGAYNAMQTLVQAFGRGMRSKEDRCENFICDDHMEWFVPRYRHLAPKSFHAHYRMMPTIPRVPEAL